VVQIVTLSGSLTDTGKDRVTSVSLGDVVDQLCTHARTNHNRSAQPPFVLPNTTPVLARELTLNQHGLSDTSTTEQTNLSTTSVRGQKVDDLDTSLQDLGDDGLVDKRRGVGVDRSLLDSLDRASVVNGLTDDVHDSSASGERA